MINPAAILAAPFAAASLALPATPPVTAADLWREGVDLSPAELSSLLEDCTGHTVEDTTDEEGDQIFYVRTPGGERLEDGYPFVDIETVEDLVGWRIDEALALLDS